MAGTGDRADVMNCTSSKPLLGDTRKWTNGVLKDNTIEQFPFNHFKSTRIADQEHRSFGPVLQEKGVHSPIEAVISKELF